MAARTVRFHVGDKVRVEPLATFAHANGTDMKGAKAILNFWAQRGWIVRRADGGFDVERQVPRRDPETLGHIRRLGHPTPQVHA
jgi:hypothetical protein